MMMMMMMTKMTLAMTKMMTMMMKMIMTLTTKSRFFIHDVSPTEAALTKLENAFVLIGLNR